MDEDLSVVDLLKLYFETADLCRGERIAAKVYVLKCVSIQMKMGRFVYFSSLEVQVYGSCGLL